MIDENLFLEGDIIDDWLRKSDIDPDQIKSDWHNGGPLTKLNVATDTTSKVTGAINKFSDEQLIGRQNGLGRSIISKAKDSIMQFPVYISKSMRASEAAIVAKLFERMYVSVVQIAFSQNPILSEVDRNNLNFLKGYHTNLNEYAKTLYNEYYIPIDDFDRMMCNSLHNRIMLENGNIVEFNAIPALDYNLKKESIRLASDALEGFNYLKEAPDMSNPSLDQEVTKTTKYKYDRLSTQETLELLLRNAASKSGAKNDLYQAMVAELRQNPQTLGSGVRNGVTANRIVGNVTSSKYGVAPNTINMSRILSADPNDTTSALFKTSMYDMIRHDGIADLTSVTSATSTDELIRACIDKNGNVDSANLATANGIDSSITQDKVEEMIAYYSGQTKNYITDAQTINNSIQAMNAELVDIRNATAAYKNGGANNPWFTSNPARASKYLQGTQLKFKFNNGVIELLNTEISDNEKTSIRKNPDIINPGVKTPELLKDKDIKKINDLDPWVINSTFRIKVGDRLYDEKNLLIGVKALLHPISIIDLEEDLDDIVTGTSRNLQKVRYKSGEITFLDYLFGFSALKQDAAKELNSSKRWINTLKRAAEYKKKRTSYMGNWFNDELAQDDYPSGKSRDSILTQLIGKNPSKYPGPLPNATLIITEEDAARLTANVGIDLHKIPNVLKLCNNLFLIAFCIVDRDAGTIQTLIPDQKKEWDISSLDAVESELAKTDNNVLMKEFNKLINRR